MPDSKHKGSQAPSKISKFKSGIHRVSQEEMSIFWEVIVSVILSKKVCMYMCPIPNGFRDRTISLNSCKIVHKDILSIVSTIGIYGSSDKDWNQEKLVQFT
jgi:hypothetical protein